MVIIKSVGALLFPSCAISFYYDAFYIVYSQLTIQSVGDGVGTDSTLVSLMSGVDRSVP